jgi:PAS domain S-box-containing protein
MKYQLQDLIDLAHFQNLQDRLNEIYSFPSAIIDNGGNVLTATGWQEVCTKFHRGNQDCLQECIKSDQYILGHLHEANPAVSYRCPHGLVDNATPIVIGGIHYGNFFTGQFFLEKPDLEFFQTQARKYGFDEAAYLEAVKRVPVWSQQQLNSYLFFIKGLIAIISESGLKRLQELETRKQVEEGEEQRRIILQTAMDGFWLLDKEGRLLEVNETYCRLSGYTAPELLTMRISDLDAGETVEGTARHIQRIIARGEDRFESRHRRKDGSEFDVEVSAQYRPTDGGRFVAFLRDITERKRAEAALQLTKFSIEHAADALFWITPDARIVDVNAAACRSLGYTREELLQLRVPDVDARYNAALWPQHFSELRRRGSMTFESEQITKAGRRFQVEIVANYVEHGGEERNCAFVRDISERKQAEAALQASEEKYRTLVDNLSLGVVVHGSDTGIQFSNRVAADLLGLTEDQLRGKTALDPRWCFLQDDELPMPISEYPVNRVLASGEGFQGQVVGVSRPDRAEPVWALCNAYPVKNGKGETVQAVITFSDITERKLAEKAARLTSDRLLLAVRAGKVATWDWDIVNDHLMWDEAMYRLYGGSPEEFSGAYEAWLQGVHPGDRAGEHDKIQQTLSGFGNYDSEFRVVWQDKSVHYIQANGFVQRDASGRPVRMLGTNWDITERKKADELLRESLREKEALLKEVHHRVKNNLQVITSLLRMEARRSEHPATKSVLQEMKSRILSMALLHESLYRSGTFAVVDLGGYLTQLTNQSFRALVTRPGAIQLRLELTSVQVEMDQALPCGLIVNELISNCLKHGFPDGRTGEVWILLQPVDGGLQLRVSDSGVGLPADFESKQGNSLGLQLVANLARQLDGRLEVGPGPGANFAVTFTPKQSKLGTANPPS